MHPFWKHPVLPVWQFMYSVCTEGIYIKHKSHLLLAPFSILLFILGLFPRMYRVPSPYGLTWSFVGAYVPSRPRFPGSGLYRYVHSQYLTTSNMMCFLAQGQGPERLVSGSDDFTLFLWSPAEDKKPLARMTGHQALINQVLFSPDSRIVASASFDKSIKLWDGRTGK